MRIYCAAIRIGLITPDRVQDDIAGQCAVGVLQEIEQQVVFSRRKLYFAPGPRRVPAIDVDFNVSELKNLSVIRSSAQQGTNSRQQFASSERLDDVIVRPHFKQQDLVYFFSHSA